MGHKQKLAQMKSKPAYIHYDIIQIDKRISEKVVELVAEFKLSHGWFASSRCC